MYFEFLGVDSGFGIRVSMTMMVGPFADQATMDVFLEACHQVVNAGKVNPHKIKFIPHARLPVNEADPNAFEVNNEGEMVPARAIQWAATSPDKFMEILNGF